MTKVKSIFPSLKVYNNTHRRKKNNNGQSKKEKEAGPRPSRIGNENNNTHTEAYNSGWMYIVYL